ncbi:MAG: hypothetical protein BWY78_00753 [Alphaproteobacteria bacterium ADurb.Bin438]|nr:MAG: hypothetical protein BWY78_00753 [Alphaproteobacteria bacterium ADurb.Bin438]
MTGHLKRKLLVLSTAVALVLSCAKNDDILQGVPVPYEQISPISVDDLGYKIEQGEIGIYQAYARAVKVNLASRFDKMSQIIKQDLSNVNDYELLPKIVALSGYNVRYSNDWNGLISSSRLKGSETNNDSIDNSSLALSTNVLDFSVVYSSAKTSKDEALALNVVKDILVKNIIHDTRIAYLKAVAGQRVKDDVIAIEAEIKEALDYVNAVVDNPEFKGNISEYRQVLLDNLSEINNLKQEISATKIRLSGLISVDPESDYRLEVPKDIDNPFIYKDLDINSMENFALNTRNELKIIGQDDYINPVEVREEVKRNFPEVEFGSSFNLVKSNYLLNQMWSNIGIKTGWNLLHLADVDSLVGVDELSIDKARSMAVKMAVLTGVDMSYQRLLQSYQEYRVASLLNDVSKDVYKKSLKVLNGGNRFDVLGRRIEAVYSRLKKDYAYAELKDAESSLHVSLGIETTPPIVMSSSVDAIARSIEQRLNPKEYENKNQEEIKEITSKTNEMPKVASNVVDDSVKQEVDAWLQHGIVKEEDKKVEPKVEDVKVAKPKKIISKKSMLKKKVPAVKVASKQGESLLQLGSYSKKQGALRAWKNVFSNNPALQGYEYIIKDVNVNGKTYHRLYVKGDKNDLIILCEQIKSTVKACLIK